jgi:hypothetical protein
MTDQDLVIELEPDDAQGHIHKWRVTGDDGWLDEQLERRTGGNRVTLKASDDDVEGHGTGTTVALRAFGEDDDDTEGHAISVHFPSRAEADEFRKRLLLTGVIVGSVALGAATGAGLASLGPEAGSAAVSGASTVDADRDIGLMDSGAAAAAAAAASTTTAVNDADRDIGLMEFGGAPADDSAGDLQSDKSGPAPR